MILLIKTAHTQSSVQLIAACLRHSNKLNLKSERASCVAGSDVTPRDSQPGFRWRSPQGFLHDTHAIVR